MKEGKMKVCGKCGGTNFVILDWIDPNTKRIIGGHIARHDSDFYCNDCDDYGHMHERPDTPEEKHTPLEWL